MPNIKDPLKWENFTCECCGKPFSKPAWHAKRMGGNYCSRACYHKGRVVSVGDRFRAHLAPPNERGCILWTGPVSSNGRGVISLGRKRDGNITAHRLAYILRHGPIPAGLIVCHKCDVALCCNPEHLFLGTNADNTHDMIEKGRNARGERNALAKLTESAVREIRDRRAKGEKYSVMAREFGASLQAVRLAAMRKTWTHVP